MIEFPLRNTSFLLLMVLEGGWSFREGEGIPDGYPIGQDNCEDSSHTFPMTEAQLNNGSAQQVCIIDVAIRFAIDFFLTRFSEAGVVFLETITFSFWKFKRVDSLI